MTDPSVMSGNALVAELLSPASPDGAPLWVCHDSHPAPLPAVAERAGDLLLLRRLAVARELLLRRLAAEMRDAPAMDKPGRVREWACLHFAGREHETFVALLLNAQNRLIAAEELFRGTISQTAVYPREVVKAVLRANAAGVIFLHNHPSGHAAQSRADESLTRTLKDVLALVDVKVLDHFVVAGASAMSFAECGLL